MNYEGLVRLAPPDARFSSAVIMPLHDAPAAPCALPGEKNS
jgi:hypothetical protein